MVLMLSPSKGNLPMSMTHSSTPSAHTSALVPSYSALPCALAAVIWGDM